MLLYFFSADDWQCSKCGNVNWARRQQCNMCNAPKFGEVEERTGYGGGYNDRGIVEYKERREEEDDEYDEFGRRKKRRKMENRSDDDSKDSRYGSPPRIKSKDIEEKKITAIEVPESRRKISPAVEKVNRDIAVLVRDVHERMSRFLIGFPGCRGRRRRGR